MSPSFERQLDLTLDVRQQHRLQRQAERAQAERAIQDSHEALEHRQASFCTHVRTLIHAAVERANRHLGKRAEKCQLCEVSGYFTGPLYVGGSACNPIAYELRVNGRELGETLLLELTHDGMVEAFLGPLRPTVPGGHTMRIDFGWRPVPLHGFDAAIASDLVLRYVAAVAAQWPLH